MVEVLTVVIGALGFVRKESDGWIERLRITNNVGVIQKTALLGTARILRKVLETYYYDSPNRGNDGNESSQIMILNNQ